MSKHGDDQDNIQDNQQQEQSEVEVVEKSEFDKLQSDFEDLTNQLKRAVADYQNLEKRVNEGRQELASWATSDVVRRLLPVLNNFEKVVSGVGEEERKSGWFKGVEMVVGQFKGVLKDEGLGEIVTDGQFDPTLHEAIDTRDGDDGKILEVVEKGYTLNGKILSPAKVVVGKDTKLSK